jgi:hypothetical protein
MNRASLYAEPVIELVVSFIDCSVNVYSPPPGISVNPSSNGGTLFFLYKNLCLRQSTAAVDNLGNLTSGFRPSCLGVLGCGLDSTMS